jgi:hypothetical protein
MNNGFFNFPTSSVNIDIKEFDVSGTYTIPQNSKIIRILAVGAGGGGGGGRKSPGSGSSYGGGGASGGGIILHEFFADALGGPGTTLTVVIGAGGGGGVGGASSGQNGTSGSNGGNTTVNITGKRGTMMVCLGGNNGSGGTIVGGSAGAARTGVYYGFPVGGLAGVAGANGSVSDSRVQGINSTFGGGGAGQSAELTSATGGRLLTGSTAQTQVLNPDLPVNTAIKSNGESGFPTMILRKYSTGYGGAGGNNAALTGTASNGGRGYRGSGGGGGGAAWTTQTAGDGGRGGDGYVVIMSFN